MTHCSIALLLAVTLLTTQQIRLRSALNVLLSVHLQKNVSSPDPEQPFTYLPMTSLNEYRQALTETELQINQLSIQRERLIGAISVLQEQEQPEEEASELDED